MTTSATRQTSRTARMIRLALLSLSALGVCTALAACDTEDPTQAVVENTYADAVVYKVWWEATLFEQPVLPNESSVEERTLPATDTAYALLAPDWDPSSGAPPKKLLVFRSKQPLTVSRGETLHIRVADATFSGSCPAKDPLSQEDADFITQRIFPGEFKDAVYDAKTCTTTRVAAPDAGAD